MPKGLKFSPKAYLERQRQDTSEGLLGVEIDIKSFNTLAKEDGTFAFNYKQSVAQKRKMEQDIKTIDEMLADLKKEPEEAKITEKK